jgi:hypothetical protein
MALKRIIKDYKSIGQEHIDLINKHFPNGFENENLISFTTPKGEFIKALEIRTEDCIYLFKIDKNMRVAEDENQDNDPSGMSDFDGFKADDSDDLNDDEEEEEEAADESSDEAADEDED